MGHAYKIKKLTGNGKQFLADKITNILADRNSTLDAVAYLGFLAQGTSNRNGSLLRDYKIKYIFIEFSFRLVEQFNIFERRKINYFHLKFSFAIRSSDPGTLLPYAAV
jgi:hypothetical protein